MSIKQQFCQQYHCENDNSAVIDLGELENESDGDSTSGMRILYF
jgi:hypothetical protein